jgi:hypothetical protein
MARSEESGRVQLATRIPKALQRKLKLYSVTAEISVMDFVTKAIEEKLAGSSGTPTEGAKPYRRARQVAVDRGPRMSSPGPGRRLFPPRTR